MSLKNSLFVFVICILFFSCKNEIESEAEFYNCYGNLTAPEVTLLETNNYPFTTGLNGSSYAFAVNVDNDCMLDQYTELKLAVDFILDGTTYETLYVSYDQNDLYFDGQRLSSTIGIRFGSYDKVSITFDMENLLGNTVKYDIKRHEGAN